MSTYVSVTFIPNIKAEKLSRLTGSFLSETEAVILDSKRLSRRREFICGRYCLKKLYQKNIEKIPLKQIIIPYKKNKPFVANREKLKCSISHTAECVATGISNKKIGIDVEKIRPHTQALLSYIEKGRSITDNPSLELEYGINLPLIVWCIKEACMKADENLHPHRAYTIIKSSVIIKQQKSKRNLQCKVKRGKWRWAVELRQVKDHFFSVAQ